MKNDFIKAIGEGQDWLYEEIKYESRIRVWDNEDKAGDIEKMHHAKCEADQIAKSHEAIHSAAKARSGQQYSNQRVDGFSSRKVYNKSNVLPIVFVVFFIFYFILFIVSFLSAFF